MQSSAIVEVAIGLVVTWLIISIATSQIQEFLVDLVGWRSTFLKNQIRNLFHQQDDYLNHFYDNPLIQALHTRGFLWFNRGPVEISKTTFAKAALDVFLNLDRPNARAGEELSPNLLSPQELVSSIKRSVAHLGTETDPNKQALARVVKRLGPTLDAEGFDITEKLEETLKNIEEWFDSAMNKATRVYRKYASFFALIIGIALAYYFNLDTIYITKKLWVEPTLREAIVAQAGNLYPGDEAGLNDTIARINGLPLPIGWSEETTPKTRDEWFLKYIGWFLTGLAAAQGSPFWFDLLRKLGGLRSQSAPPPASG
jgi:hypothetical protein